MSRSQKSTEKNDGSCVWCGRFHGGKCPDESDAEFDREQGYLQGLSDADVGSHYAFDSRQEDVRSTDS